MKPSNEQPLVTPEDHDNGFKIIAVEFRSGRKAQLKLTAPDHRTATEVSLKISETRSLDPAVEACHPEFTDNTAGPLNLNKLTPDSANVVIYVALALTFGDSFQKKMLQAGATLLQSLTRTPRGDVKPSSSAPVSDQVKSEDSASPSSSSGQPSSRSSS